MFGVIQNRRARHALACRQQAFLCSARSRDRPQSMRSGDSGLEDVFAGSGRSDNSQGPPSLVVLAGYGLENRRHGRIGQGRCAEPHPCSTDRPESADGADDVARRRC